MFKKFFAVLIVWVFVLVIARVTFAQQEQSNQPTQSKSEINVGNKICPVTGEKIDESAKATYKYQGKIYNFCCPVCIDEFKKDPEKYIKKIEEEKMKKSSEQISRNSGAMEEMPGNKHH